MTVTFDSWLLQGVHAKLDLILARSETLAKEVTDMSAEIDALTAEVAKIKTVSQSAVALIKGLSDAVKAAGTDAVALAALTADLDAQTNALAAAVSANTPTTP